jgi:hypothetical protein
MDDSLSPNNRNPLDRGDAPEGEVSPTKGLKHEDLANPEEGLVNTGESTGQEPGTPEHVHRRRLSGSGDGAIEEESTSAPSELSTDDKSLLTGNPKAPPV